MSTQSTETGRSTHGYEFTIGERLQRARDFAGLDQQQLADRIGASRNTISNYENGTTKKLKAIYLKAWALATGVPLEWIETGRTPASGGGNGGAIASAPDDPAFPSLGSTSASRLFQWRTAA